MSIKLSMCLLKLLIPFVRRVLRRDATPPAVSLPTYFRREEIDSLERCEVEAIGVGEERFEVRGFLVPVLGRSDAVRRGQAERGEMVEAVLGGLRMARIIAGVLSSAQWRFHVLAGSNFGTLSRLMKIYGRKELFLQ